MHPLLSEVLSTQSTFQDADDAWSDEMRRQFKSRYVEARYGVLGRGEPDSLLRALYDRRQQAMIAWHSAIDTYRKA